MASTPITSWRSQIHVLRSSGRCWICAASTPNSAANGVWLHRTLHAPIHTNASYANVNAVMAKHYFGAWRPTSELVNDLARIGQLLEGVSFRCSRWMI
jgi:hypothetical protein